jgi:phosphoserine aminotransferase
MMNEVLKWVKANGGAAGMEARNLEKANLIYDVIDGSNGFYRGFAEKGSRSIMNVTFTLASEELEKQFIKESEAKGFVGLKGHRSVGGLRASIYNAVTPESVRALAEFMRDFQSRNA